MPKKNQMREETSQVALSQGLTSAERARLQALENQLYSQKRGSMSERIKACVKSGRLSVAMARKMLDNVSRVRLSLLADGAVAVPASVELAVEIAEANPAGMLFNADQRAQEFTEHGHDDFFAGDGAEMTPEAAKKLVDETYA